MCFAEARWCVTSDKEMEKCKNVGYAITERMQTSDVYPPWLKKYQELPELKCVQVSTFKIISLFIERG